MSGSLTQFGIGKETVYGTEVVTTKFFEIMNEDISGNYARVQAEALSSSFVDRADRFGVAAKGAAGSVALEPLTKGFGSWLKWMMGDLTSTARSAPDAAAVDHVAPVGNLFGDMITVQVGRAQVDGTIKPWTYGGGKVTNWELSNQVDQTLRANIGMDFARESSPASPTGAFALATPTLPTLADIFMWQGATLTYNSVAMTLPEFSVRMDNQLNVDRYFLGQAGIKKEPTQDGKRSIEFSFRSSYDDYTYWNKVSSATNAGSYASLVAKWTGLTSIPGTTTPVFPSLTVTIPVARLDEGAPRVAGPGMLEQSITGRGLYDGTNAALTLTYTSLDTGALTLQ